MKSSIVIAIALCFLFSGVSFAAPVAGGGKVPAKRLITLCASDTISRADREKDSQKPLPPPPKPKSDDGKGSGSPDKPKPAPKHPTDTL